MEVLSIALKLISLIILIFLFRHEIKTFRSLGVYFNSFWNKCDVLLFIFFMISIKFEISLRIVEDPAEFEIVIN